MNASLKAAIEFGHHTEIVEICERFRSLPEFGMTKELRQVETAAKEVEDLLAALTTAKRALVSAALGLATKVDWNWTPDEIEAATGYKV